MGRPDFPGPLDEASQAVAFLVDSNTNPDLFAVVPSINGTGLLSFTPAPDTIGSAPNEIFALDNGGIHHGGDPVSDPVSFAIEVIAATDLIIEKTSDSFFTLPGGSVTYTIEVRNPGPSDVLGARVLDDPPPRLGNVIWACVAATGATCNPSGSVLIDELVVLQEGSRVIFQLDATLLDALNDPITNQAEVVTPPGVLELDMGSNAYSDTDLVGLFADGFESAEP